MAKAGAKNTRSVATIQEAPYAPARYIENSDASERPQHVTDRDKHLIHLQETLCTIAKDLNLTDPESELQAKAIRIELVRRIDYHRSSLARDLHYGRFIDENSDARLYYFIRLTSIQLKIGQRRGSKSALSRASAIEEAAATKNISQLNTVERRAFDILKGARRKPRKNLVERQAIQLADVVKKKWFSPRQVGRPKGKWTRKPDVEARSFEAMKPPLTLTDLVSIAAPVIGRRYSFLRRVHDPRGRNSRPQRCRGLSVPAARQAASNGERPQGCHH